MKRVIVESPFAGNIITRFLNRRYARACVRDCILRGESPIASHLLFTQRGILRDGVQEERKLGIDAGHAWIPAVDQMVVYTDRGISRGMRKGMERADQFGLPVEFRNLRPGGQA